ncbi:unnamed protein product [Clavelina lepadiformis]|uniref:Uncharacterized protein n=1 Tax=Clavelina lepadiformis TaxID=159417 RepID=A0ABP0GS99_CLALP
MAIEANSALKKHLLINSFEEDLSWDVRGRDASLFDLPYAEEQLVRQGTRTERVNTLICQCLKEAGQRGIQGREPRHHKERGLKSHKSSEALSANLGIGRDFFAASRQAIAFYDEIKESSRVVLKVNAHPRLEQSSQKEVTTLVENEIAGAQRRSRNFNKSARCQVT